MAIQRRKRANWLTLEQAGRIARENGCTSRKTYSDWHDRARPNNIPKKPERVYADWLSWPEFLGTNNVFAKYEKGNFRPYWEAVRYIQPICIKNGLDTSVKWLHYFDANEQEIPDDIPKHANYHYSEEWKGWPTWLGLGIEVKIETARVKVGVFALATTEWAQANWSVLWSHRMVWFS